MSYWVTGHVMSFWELILPYSIREIRPKSLWLSSFDFTMLNWSTTQKVIELNRFVRGHASLVLTNFCTQPEMNVLFQWLSFSNLQRERTRTCILKNSLTASIFDSFVHGVKCEAEVGNFISSRNLLVLLQAQGFEWHDNRTNNSADNLKFQFNLN